MSKYNLTDIHKGIIKESMSRGGTIKDSFYNIANLADDIDGQNIGIDTYPIYVQRLGPSADEKTYEEFSIRYGGDRDDRFNIYDYKFGEDPTNEDNYQNDYPFSLGVPTGNKSAVSWAKKLGFEVEGMQQPAQFEGENPNSMAESSVDETEFDFFKTILDGRYKEDQIEDYLKSDDYEAAQDEFKLDDTYTSDWVQEFANYFESRMDEGDAYDADKDTDAMIAQMKKDGKDADDFVDEGLREHFQRFLKDYQ